MSFHAVTGARSGNRLLLPSETLSSKARGLQWPGGCRGLGRRVYPSWGPGLWSPVLRPHLWSPWVQSRGFMLPPPPAPHLAEEEFEAQSEDGCTQAGPHDWHIPRWTWCLGGRLKSRALWHSQEVAGGGAGACYPDISVEDLCRSQGNPGALGVLLGGVVVSKTPVSEPASFPPAPSFHQPHELGGSPLPGPQALQWPLRSSCCSSLVSASPVLRCASESIIRGYLPSVTLPTVCSTNSPQHTPPFGGPSVAYTAVFKLLGNFKVSCVHPFRVCDGLRIQRGTKIAPVLPSGLGAETLKNHTHARTHTRYTRTHGTHACTAHTHARHTRTHGTHTRTHARHTCKVTAGIRGQRGRGGSGSR